VTSDVRRWRYKVPDGRSEVMSNYEDVKDSIYSCECGWRGPIEDCPKELFWEYFVVFCPTCNAKLDTVLFPELDEMKRGFETYGER